MKMRSLFLAATLLPLMAPSAARAQAQARVTAVTTVRNHAPASLRLHVTCRDSVAYGLDATRLQILDNGLPARNVAIRNSASTQSRKPFKAMLVLDHSGSMTGPGITALINASRALVRFMDPATDSIGIIAFNSQATLRSPFTNDTAALMSIINGFAANGMTAVWDAAYMGVQQVAALQDTMSHAVVVMTDGGDNSSSRSPAEVIALAQAGGKRVFTIGLGSLVNTAQLQAIASLTGGQYYETPDPAVLTTIFLQIASFMQRDFDEYTITYDTPDRGAALHAVTVTVTVCDTTLAATASRPAAADAAPLRDIAAPLELRWTRATDTFDPNPFTASLTLRNTLAVELRDIEAELDLARAPHLRAASGETVRGTIPVVAARGSATLAWTLEVASTPPAPVIERIAVRFREAGDSAWTSATHDIAIGGGARTLQASCASRGHDTLWADAAYEDVIPQPLQLQYTITNTGDVPLEGCAAAIVHSPAYALLDPADSIRSYGGPIAPGASVSREWLLAARFEAARPGPDTIAWVWSCDGLAAGTSCAHAVTLLVGSPPGVAFSPWLLRFGAERNGPLPAARELRIWTGGNRRNAWFIVDEPAWMGWTPTFADTTCTVAMRPVTTALAEGAHEARMIVVAQGASSPPAIEVIYDISASTAAEPPAAPQGAMLGAAFPQPARGITTIEYALDRAGWTEIMLTDLLGRRMATLLARDCAAGRGSLRFDASTLAPGLYLATISSEGRVASRAFIVRR